MMGSADAPTSLRGVVPALLVKSMAETLSFYEALGFRLTGCQPERVSAAWAEVTRDSAILQFHTEPPVDTPSHPSLSGTLYFQTNHLDALAAEFRDKVSFAWGPEWMDYGAREFGILDPNGYFLAFTESAPAT